MKARLRRWLSWLWQPDVMAARGQAFSDTKDTEACLEEVLAAARTRADDQHATLRASLQDAVLATQVDFVAIRASLAAHGDLLGVHSQALATREEQEQRDLWVRRIAACTQEQRAILERVFAVLEAPTYAEARGAVRSVAQTLNFNHPEMWVPYGRALKSDPGGAENVFRHTKAVQDVKAAFLARGITLSNPEAHLAVELAYVGFSVTT